MGTLWGLKDKLKTLGIICVILIILLGIVADISEHRELRRLHSMMDKVDVCITSANKLMEWSEGEVK